MKPDHSSSVVQGEQERKGIRPATPLPWEDLPAARSSLVHVEAGDAGGHAAVCSIPKSRARDASYIVHACNNYGALVDALQTILACDDGDSPGLWEFETEYDAARALLQSLGETK